LVGTAPTGSQAKFSTAGALSLSLRALYALFFTWVYAFFFFLRVFLFTRWGGLFLINKQTMTAKDKEIKWKSREKWWNIPDEEFVQWLEWLDNVEDDFEPSWIEYLKTKNHE
jgi:hypothetical protein